ncbi:MAG: class I SAM-dependent methyltransferase [Oscillospiraceae bacterium]
MQKIDDRLLAATDFVRGGTVADIGCDHGKLSVFLVQSGKAKRVIASDVRQSPLDKAKKLVEKLGLGAKIDCRLADGLNALAPLEAQDIIIAGMSGVTLTKIMSEVSWAKNEALRFILVPASKAEVLRRWLYENGFEIADETPVLTKGYYYPVICTQYTGKCVKVTDDFAYLGKCLHKKSNVADGLRQKVLKELKKELDGKKIDARYTDEDIKSIEKCVAEIEKV